MLIVLSSINILVLSTFRTFPYYFRHPFHQNAYKITNKMGNCTIFKLKNVLMFHN